MSLLKIDQRTYDLTTTFFIMGILNRTPDSFYDKGRYFDLDSFLARAEYYVKTGADILDVGGVKAGPGKEVSETEEIERVVPAIELLRKNFDVFISVDTFRASVLKESLEAGASIANDISGFQDPQYLQVASKYGATVVATHIRLSPRVPDPQPEYRNITDDVVKYLKNKMQQALDYNVEFEKIVLDPGLDLGKTPGGSIALSTKAFYQQLLDLKRPILLSGSRKTFLGEIFNLEVGERLWPSVSLAAISYLNGARLFRVHDVKETRSALNTLKILLEESLKVE